MLSWSASSNAAWERWGSAATASGFGWGGGSIRFCVERTSGPVCHVSSASSLLRRLSPSSFNRYRRRFAPVCRCTSIGFPFGGLQLSANQREPLDPRASRLYAEQSGLRGRDHVEI